MKNSFKWLFTLALVMLPVLPSPGRDKKPADKQYMEVDLGGDVKMKLVRIEAGKFMMGSPKSDFGRWGHEGPQHEVEITKAFHMGVYAVTQAEYEKVSGVNPSQIFPGRYKEAAGLDTSRFPVEMVTWDQAMEFCRKLSKKAGKTIDLPTEAEWEYACRAGSTGPFHYGNALSSKQANFNGNFPYGGGDKGPYLQRTTEVGSYQPNAFGLYDMHGNVSQWCKDWFKEDFYSASPARDPQGPTKGTNRVVRGGSWINAANISRSAFRSNRRPDYREAWVGFRVVVRVP